MLQEYGAAALQILVALAIAAGGIATSILLGKRARGSQAKDSAYECGKPSVGKIHPRFSVRFYLVAMIFILFDIEVVFMYPWAVNYKQLIAGEVGLRALWVMLAFVTIVETAHLYAYKKGAFDWQKRG